MTKENEIIDKLVMDLASYDADMPDSIFTYINDTIENSFYLVTSLEALKKVLREKLHEIAKQSNTG
jgi:Mrp family chromosome partitioning ATPase